MASEAGKEKRVLDVNTLAIFHLFQSVYGTRDREDRYLK